MPVHAKPLEPRAQRKRPIQQNRIGLKKYEDNLSHPLNDQRRRDRPLGREPIGILKIIEGLLELSLIVVMDHHQRLTFNQNKNLIYDKTEGTKMTE